MKEKIVLILLCCTKSFLFSQGSESIKEKTLVILSSADNTVPPSLKSELDSLDRNYLDAVRQQYQPEDSITSDPAFKRRPRNHQTMILEGNRFIKDINFFNSVGYNISTYLQSIYIEYDYKNFCVVALNESAQSGRVDDMQKKAFKFKVKYVLNVYKIKLLASPLRKAVIEAELFSVRTNRQIFKKKFEGDAVNSGGYFMCDEGSMSCCLNNATQKLFYEVLKTID